MAPESGISSLTSLISEFGNSFFKTDVSCNSVFAIEGSDNTALGIAGSGSPVLFKYSDPHDYPPVLEILDSVAPGSTRYRFQ